MSNQPPDYTQPYYQPGPGPQWQPPQPPKRPWVARHKVLTALLGVVALFVVGGVVGALASSKTPSTNLGLGSSQNSPAPYQTPNGVSTDTTSPPPPPSSTVTLAVGQTETVEDNNNPADTATITITSMTNTTQSYDGYSQPQNGVFVVANVTVTSKFDGFNVNDLDFYALVNGQHYDEGNGNSIFAVANDQYLTTTLNTGESTTGQLYFDLPTPHGQVVYSPNLDGTPLAAWSF